MGAVELAILILIVIMFLMRGQSQKAKEAQIKTPEPNLPLTDKSPTTSSKLAYWVFGGMLMLVLLFF
jgi:hypothetical protein